MTREVILKRGTVLPTLSDNAVVGVMCKTLVCFHVNRGIITWFTQLNFNETRTVYSSQSVQSIKWSFLWHVTIFSENWNCIMILPIHYVNELFFFQKLLSGIGIHTYTRQSFCYRIQSAMLQSRLIFPILIMKVHFRIFVHIYFPLMLPISWSS